MDLLSEISAINAPERTLRRYRHITATFFFEQLTHVQPVQHIESSDATIESLNDEEIRYFFFKSLNLYLYSKLIP